MAIKFGMDSHSDYRIHIIIATQIDILEEILYSLYLIVVALWDYDYWDE